MMGRTFPALLMILGLGCFSAAFATGRMAFGFGTIVAYVYAFIVPLLLVWSYFFGPQRGRPVHFLQISVYFGLGLVSLLYAVGKIGTPVSLVFMSTLFAVLIYGASVNYRAIRNDYKNGVSRNFFK